jgi:hypothetical protein
MISLERRLQLGLVLSIAGFTLLFLLLGGYAVRRLSEDYVLSRLEHDAEALLGAARVAGPYSHPDTRRSFRSNS